MVLEFRSSRFSMSAASSRARVFSVGVSPSKAPIAHPGQGRAATRPRSAKLMTWSLRVVSIAIHSCPRKRLTRSITTHWFAPGARTCTLFHLAAGIGSCGTTSAVTSAASGAAC